jgi:hypothetical protein
VYSAGIRSNFGSSYRRTQAVTRHSPSGRDSTTATREPQLFVHVTEEERMELQRAFDQAAANAGTLASSYPADSKSTLISLPARSPAPSCTHPCTHTHTHTHTQLHFHTPAHAYRGGWGAAVARDPKQDRCALDGQYPRERCGWEEHA